MIKVRSRGSRSSSRQPTLPWRSSLTSTAVCTGRASTRRSSRPPLRRNDPRLPGSAAGLHAYDGHIHDYDPSVRRDRCEAAFAPCTDSRAPGPSWISRPRHRRRRHANIPNSCPAFGRAVQSRHERVLGRGYETLLPDLDFLPAVLVLTRVISKPSARILCLDLGHKAIASEGPHPRVELLGLPDARATGHSEEHLTVETEHAGDYRVGRRLWRPVAHLSHGGTPLAGRGRKGRSGGSALESRSPGTDTNHLARPAMQDCSVGVEKRAGALRPLFRCSRL